LDPNFPQYTALVSPSSSLCAVVGVLVLVPSSFSSLLYHKKGSIKCPLFIRSGLYVFLHALLSLPVENQCSAQGHDHPRTSMAVLCLFVSPQLSLPCIKGCGTSHSGVSPISLCLICNLSFFPRTLLRKSRGYVHYGCGSSSGKWHVTVLPHISTFNIQPGDDAASLTKSRLQPRTLIRPRPYPPRPAYHTMPLIPLHVLHRPPRAPQLTAPSPVAVRTTRRTATYASTGPGLILTLLFFIQTVEVRPRGLRTRINLKGNAPT